jgi:uncharacterized protein YmfQ (DUF2313 family)
MSHKDVLKQLFPIELGGVHDADLEIEGSHLDEALARSEQLLREVFPDTAGECIADWERVCAITPGAEDPLQLRRQRVVAKLLSRGGLSVAYFTHLAEEMDYTITIEELAPSVESHGNESVFIWRVTVHDTEGVYHFRAGQSRAGERLLWWTALTGLEGLFTDLKPAHTQIIFIYA